MSVPQALAVLIVDDDVALCRALTRVLQGGGFRALAAQSAQAGLEVFEREGEDSIGVVISDFAMPGMDGVDFLHTVRLKWPRCARIMLTGMADLSAASRAVNEGQVARLLLKPIESNVLIGIVKELLEQRSVSDVRADALDKVAQLTPRERDVLRCLARGASNAEIAADLHVTPGSARIYVNRLLAKLHLPDRTRAALYARSIGLS